MNRQQQYPDWRTALPISSYVDVGHMPTFADMGNMKFVRMDGRISNYPAGIFACPKCRQEVRIRYHNGVKSDQCFACYQKQKRGSGNPKYRHGQTVNGYSKLYYVWSDMKSRATNVNHARADRYILRGIGICEEWKEAKKFIDWALASGYRKGLTLDRIDNNGDYCPENCRWVTNAENCRNGSRAKINVETAKKIKDYLGLGYKHRIIAEMTGATVHIVRSIKQGKSWQQI